MAIIKYRVEATICKADKNKDRNVIGSAWIYEEILGNPKLQGKVITKEEAMKRIKEKGLIKVHSNKHGVIWDYPSEPMLERYGKL